MKKYRSFLLVMLLLLGAGCFLVWKYYPLSPPPVSPEAPFRVLFLDVGQGDAALVGCENHWLLIDGGGRESAQKIYSVLKKRGITHLDMVIASHPHEDHIGGLSAALQGRTVGLLLSPTESDSRECFQDLCRSAGETVVTVPRAGDRYALGSATVEILGLNAGPTENAASIVAKLTYGAVSFLFTGDMEAEYFDPQWNLSATVLKVSHHGSSSGTSRELLERVSPKYAVISLGKDNPYFLPHQRVLNLLDEQCANLFRTDLQGDILFTSQGDALSVSTQKDASSREIFTPGGETLGENTVSTAPQGYVINANSKVFHLPVCPSTQTMKDSNKRFTQDTREELIAQGYKPCGNCKP